MNNLNQRGFSLLHILPMVAIVALVAVVGVKVFNKSGAATPLTCSVTAYRVSSKYVNMTMKITNNTSTATHLYADFKRNGATATTVPTGGSYLIGARGTATLSGSVAYAPGSYAGAVRSNGITTWCSGYYRF